jgi:hypothetical protein
VQRASSPGFGHDGLTNIGRNLFARVIYRIARIRLPGAMAYSSFRHSRTRIRAKG